MRNTRRNFIKGTGAAFLGNALERVHADSPPTTQPNITALLQSSGFTPGGPNSALLAIIGDVHINLDTNSSTYTDKIDDRLVNELNGLTPAITDLTVVGDLILHNSFSIGGPRYPSHYALSRLEFRKAKTELGRFRSGINIRAVPGNHDTDREENDAELWREELQLPPYQKSILGGVPVFSLNSGHVGLMDPAQAAWFESEARLIPPDQEVVIVAHHPSFLYVIFETALKRHVYNAFSQHHAPVWLVGGHGHGFAEQLLVSGTSRFVQMEVTTANPKQWSDNRTPGYVLLALQDGRVVRRLFRATKESGFEAKLPVSQLRSYPLVWPIDSVRFPAAFYEEGFYNRQGKLVQTDGVDLKSYFTGCRNFTVRVDLSGSQGKITEFHLAAYINSSLVPPTCLFSTTGLDGSWTTVQYPSSTAADQTRVFVIPIPVQFRNAQTLFIKTRSQLQGPNDGINISGWGLGADGTLLTGYEKWLAIQYRTILSNSQTRPEIKPTGSNLTNLEHYAFNIPLPVEPSQGTAASLSVTPPVTGQPVYSRTFCNIIDFRFARRPAAIQSSVEYGIEHSYDLVNWTMANPSQFKITPLDSIWEEVQCKIPSPAGKPLFCRAKVTSLDSSGGTGYLAAGDANGDGIDDILQYAFDLQPSDGGTRVYDPLRATRKSGLPVQSLESGLISRLVYPRVRAAINPGVKYLIEETDDLKEWTAVPGSSISERVIRSSGDMDEIEALILDSAFSRRFYRLRLELSAPLAS